MKSALVIGDRAALAALPDTVWRRRPTHLRLELPGLQPRDRARAEARLARRLSACGCNEGALALIAALPVAPVLASAWADGAARWALGAGLVVLAAAAGKALGLWRARKALRAEVAAVAAALQGSPSQ